MRVRITSKLLGEWEGDLDDLLEANPELNPELALNLKEGESAHFLSSEQFVITRPVGEGIINTPGTPTIRNLVKYQGHLPEKVVFELHRRGGTGYTFTFEALVNGSWVKYGPECFDTHTEPSEPGPEKIQLGWDQLDSLYSEHAEGRLYGGPVAGKRYDDGLRCDGDLLYETVGGVSGMRVFRQVGLRKFYKAKCSICHQEHQTNGNRTKCNLPDTEPES